MHRRALRGIARRLAVIVRTLEVVIMQLGAGKHRDTARAADRGPARVLVNPQVVAIHGVSLAQLGVTMAGKYGHDVTDPLPRPVPTGTDRYYRDRLADFAARCPDATPPSYYADYGDKCLHQFRRTEPNLTPEGQRWLQQTLVGLQDRLESLRADDPAAFGRLEHDGNAFEKMAFEMHSAAYLESGVADLPLADLWKIAKTPDISDLLTPKGLEEILDVLAGMGGKSSSPARRLLRVGLGRLIRLWTCARPRML